MSLHDAIKQVLSAMAALAAVHGVLTKSRNYQSSTSREWPAATSCRALAVVEYALAVVEYASSGTFWVTSKCTLPLHSCCNCNSGIELSLPSYEEVPGQITRQKCSPSVGAPSQLFFLFQKQSRLLKHILALERTSFEECQLMYLTEMISV